MRKNISEVNFYNLKAIKLEWVTLMCSFQSTVTSAFMQKNLNKIYRQNKVNKVLIKSPINPVALIKSKNKKFNYRVSNKFIYPRH